MKKGLAIGLSLAGIGVIILVARAKAAPPENGDIITPGFSYGIPVVSIKTSEIASAFRVASVSCSITNPSNSSQTRTIYCCWAFSPTDSPYYREWGNYPLGVAYQLTLNPGQTVTLTSPYSYLGDDGILYDNAPGIGQTGGIWNEFWYWFKDDLGYESEKVLA